MNRQLVILGLALLTCLGLSFWLASGAIALGNQNLLMKGAMASGQSVTPAANVTEGSCVEGQTIDLNNANAVAFTDCPGFYPTLAKEIVTHGPYESVEDVLNIPGLNDQQRELLQKKLDLFSVSEARIPIAQRMPPRSMMR
ncbi:photosystem II complex extrinsic protein PsbU [Acaryochloris thomasi]|nr:photosystem II complex extrinsic protein PsbU [Acaryochloris thomasi]